MKAQVTRLKVIPPLRFREHIEGLWEGLRQGRFPVISSDHALWHLEKKSDPEVLKSRR